MKKLVSLLCLLVLYEVAGHAGLVRDKAGGSSWIEPPSQT